MVRCAGGVRASPVSCWTRALSSALSRDISGALVPPPPPEPPRRPCPPPPPDLVLPSPAPAQSRLNPISSGRWVSAGSRTQRPATLRESGWLIGVGGDCAAA